MDLVLIGATIGMANALLAIGLVLIYKANRVINLAHGELGAFAVAMMLALTRSAHLNYWLALACSLAATGVLAAIIERSFLRRLFSSPRLIVLIATIGIAQLIIVLRLIMPKPRAAGGAAVVAGGPDIFPVPFHFDPIQFKRVTIGPPHVLALIIGPLLALAVFAFLRYSAYGIALRASAENMARARLLGIPVGRVSTLAWVVAGVTAGMAGILLAPIIGFSASEAVGLPILMRGLAAAMAARMDSVPTAFGVGLGLGVLDHLVFFWTGRSGLTDLVLLGVILTTLLARRRANRRTVDAEETSWDVGEPVRALPEHIRSHPAWRGALAIGGVLAAGIVIVAPLPLGDSATFFVATVALIAVVAVSATVLTGWAGQMSLGQWALAGVGGIFGAKLVVTWGLPYWLAFIVATIAGGIIALILGLPAVRLEGTALAVVTLGFSVAAASWLFEQSWFSGTGFVDRPEFLKTSAYYFVSLALLAVAVFAARTFGSKRIGRNMIAVRDNPAQAAAMGVSITTTKLTAFVFSGVLASAAGFLWSLGIGVADSGVFEPIRSLSIVAAIVIGGLGSVAGAIVGAVYLLGIPYFLNDVSPYIGLMSSGAGLLLLVMLLPGGLARVMFSGRDRLAERITGQQVRT